MRLLGNFGLGHCCWVGRVVVKRALGLFTVAVVVSVRRVLKGLVLVVILEGRHVGVGCELVVYVRLLLPPLVRGDALVDRCTEMGLKGFAQVDKVAVDDVHAP